MVFAEPIIAYKRTHMVTVLIKQFGNIMGKTPDEKFFLEITFIEGSWSLQVYVSGNVAHYS